MSVLGDKLRCPHCLEELDNLEDPKQLPCSHVFCSPCLESLTKTEKGSVETTCSICSKCHKVESLADLPTPKDESSEHNTNRTNNSETADSQEGTVRPEKRCDRCKEETTAVCYCVECDKSLCPRHEQAHKEFIGEDDDHKLISIQTYLLKPNFYMKPKCHRHKMEFAMSCEKCFLLRCKECTEDCKCEENNVHFFKTIKDIRSQLQAEFAGLTKAVSDKMTEMCKLEKETWQKLDNLELECDRLKREVKEKTKEMINEINEQQDGFLAMIEKHVSDRKTQVETQLQELRIRREEMEALRLESELLTRNNHVMKIIENRKVMVGELKEAAEAKERKWDEADLLILEKSLKIHLCRSMSMIPDKLEFISSQTTGGGCYTTLFRKDGRLLVGCQDGIREYCQYGDGFKKLTAKPNVTTVARLLGDSLCFISILGMSRTTNVLKVSPLNPYLHEPVSTSMFSYIHPSNKLAKCVSASEKYVAATTGKTSIELYDNHTKTNVSEELGRVVHQLHFFSDDHLITTDDQSVCMYRIEEINSLHLVWKFTGVEKARGVCTTENGLIICTSKTKKVIYILSDKGNIVLCTRDYE